MGIFLRKNSVYSGRISGWRAVILMTMLTWTSALQVFVHCWQSARDDFAIWRNVFYPLNAGICHGRELRVEALSRVKDMG